MTEEDEAFEQIEKAQGWRKRQIVQRQLSVEENMARNEVLEEIATVFDKMRNSRIFRVLCQGDEAMTDKQKTCQVCRVNPAVLKSINSRGAPQWRCQTCHDLKNRAGFTKGKQ